MPHMGNFLDNFHKQKQLRDLFTYRDL